ncbi:hypothetical protein HCN44_002977 [Aphidius gifuensis]|uniref:Rho-GAP domain-containing protein n=1 Tax=Aphidius gifuensis TaxID=684658 RepID=A0A835CSM8_APHGI|nr:ralA-binding protein 1 [Aphidius gifuensis]KAF7991415.1 hypothetical protein HCN44_002977 [Aphidius gifuensis]
MDFESPDVEKEFPGLYASESARKSNESDFSDDGGHDKHSKKDLLGKKKDKKDKKDRGYATLEGESSPDEDQETKSPSKLKKTIAFKFPSKKREKSREKDSKEKDKEDKDKEKKKRDKDEKDMKDKLKHKLKDRKKGKHGLEDSLDISEVQPIFGVSLQQAVEHSRCHDGVELPLVVRDCIDYLEENGMTSENLYKVPGVKSKIQNLKKLYNQREPVKHTEFEPTTATSLLILFFRELPEPILKNSDTITKFEQAASTKDLSQREQQLQILVNQLPECNRILLGWFTLHLDNITIREKTTKIDAQTIAMTLSPVLQMSHRLLLALLFHCKSLFSDIKIVKYIPPLASGSTNLPDNIHDISVELAKQESLLSEIHMLMNAGFVTKSREEQLWEVQRLITQLKRKYKSVQKKEGQLIQKSLDEEIKSSDENQIDSYKDYQDESRHSSLSVGKNEFIKSPIDNLKLNNNNNNNNNNNDVVGVAGQSKDVVDATNVLIVDDKNLDNVKDINNDNDGDDDDDDKVNDKIGNVVNDVNDDSVELIKESLIHEELLNMESMLRTKIIQEKNEIKKLVDKINKVGPDISKPIERLHSPNEAEITAMIQLAKENQLLEKKMMTLIRSIMEERDACVELRVELTMHQMMSSQNNVDLTGNLY